MSSEQHDLADVPAKYKPLSAWAYFGYEILFAIPLVGFILLIVFSFNNDNLNRRSFARSYFCIYIVAIVIAVLVIVIGGTSILALFSGS